MVLSNQCPNTSSLAILWTRFVTPDPTLTDIEEFKLLEKSPTWYTIRRDFSKWSDSHKETQFAGEEDVSALFTWNNAMQTRFEDMEILNPIAQARLAISTFTQRAQAWWRAHRIRVPNLIVSYDQLLEWIKRELVPRSDSRTTVTAWMDLAFTGDVNKYLKDLDHLMMYHPLSRTSLITMATRPLGKVFSSRIEVIDANYGSHGLTFPQLKKVISNHLIANRQQARQISNERQFAFTPRPTRNNPPSSNTTYSVRKENIPNQKESKFHFVNTSSNASKPDDHKNTVKKQVATTTSPPPKRKIGKGPTPCFVCGTDQHAWILCPKKKKGKCGCCGSEAHLTRMCAQRYHPEVHMKFHHCPSVESDETNYVYIPENEPLDDSDEEECDIEECENELENNDASEAIEENIEDISIHFNAHSLCFPTEAFSDDDDDSDSSLSQKHSESVFDAFTPTVLPVPEFNPVPLSQVIPPYKSPQYIDGDEFVVTDLNGCPSDADDESPSQDDNKLTKRIRRPPPARVRFNICWKPERCKTKSEIIELEQKRMCSESQESLGSIVPPPSPKTPATTDNTLPTPDELVAFIKEHGPKPRYEIDELANKCQIYESVLKSYGVPLNEKWVGMFKLLHDNTYPHLKPIQPPNKFGQLLYEITIEGFEVTTLLDSGASHSFITRTWANAKGLELIPLRPARPVGLFSGHKNYIRHVAYVKRVGFREYHRAWKFYIIDSAPFPCILGLDAIMSWPIFSSPLDTRIFIMPELFFAPRGVGDLGGIYQYWNNRDGVAHAKYLSHLPFKDSISYASNSFYIR